MGRLNSAFRSRLLPAILTATGVSLIAGGLLTYTGAAEVDPSEPQPTIIAIAPTPTIPLPTFAPSGSPDASPSPSPIVVDRVATRVYIPALDIDLPVVKPAGGAGAYPQCNVAMYLEADGLHQPGQGGATYIYAHARPGMFGPIYERAIKKRNGGPKSMIGMLVEVFTSDDIRFTYEIIEVRLNQRNLTAAVNATSEELWLQTSEGPKGTPGKTQLRAIPLAIGAATHEEAHPKARPVNCA